MGDIVNLRRARKRKARAAGEVEAAEHRAAFGVSKVARRTARAEREIAERRLSAHRLDDAGAGREDDAN